MKEAKKDRITRAAMNANGRSFSCSRCQYNPCSESCMIICNKAFVEGFKKGVEWHKKQQKGMKGE